jgi:hypothetical protein
MLHRISAGLLSENAFVFINPLCQCMTKNELPAVEQGIPGRMDASSGGELNSERQKMEL